MDAHNDLDESVAPAERPPLAWWRGPAVAAVIARAVGPEPGDTS